jgi:hypothetical protein
MPPRFRIEMPKSILPEAERVRGEEIPKDPPLPKTEDPARMKPHEEVGLHPQEQQGSYLGDYYRWLHEDIPKATSASDYVNRVMPRNLSQTVVGALWDFPYYGIKQFTDPIINQGIYGHDLPGMMKGLGKAAVGTAKGIAHFAGEPFGAFGMEKMKERWETDPFGSLLALSSWGEGMSGYGARIKGVVPPDAGLMQHDLFGNKYRDQNIKITPPPSKGLSPVMQHVMKPVLNEHGQIEIADTPFGEVKVLINPTQGEIEGYWKNPMRAGNSKDILSMFHDAQHGPLKFADDGKDIYVWDAFEATHRDIGRYYGIAPVGKGEFFTPEQFNVERRGR